MATCDQILEMFSPCSTLHIIIVIDSSAMKRSIDIYYTKISVSVLSAQNLILLLLLCCV